MKRRILSIGAALLLCGAQAALAAQLSVLCAGAIEPGIRPALAEFEKASGHNISLSFATAPQIRQRIEAGAVVDVLIAPKGVLDELEKAEGSAPTARNGCRSAASAWV